MMKLFIAPGNLKRVTGQVGLASMDILTIVLQTEGGPVGFERDDGPTAMLHFLTNCIAIERANSPAWIEPNNPGAKAFIIRHSGKGVIAAQPTVEVVSALESVRFNEQQRKKNTILSRHGKAPVALRSTYFDQWVQDDYLLREESLIWLLNQCGKISVWLRSDFGLHARMISTASGSLVPGINAIAATIGIPVIQVEGEHFLPVW